MILLQHIPRDAGFPLADCRTTVDADASGIYVVHDTHCRTGMSPWQGRSHHHQEDTPWGTTSGS